MNLFYLFSGLIFTRSGFTTSGRKYPYKIRTVSPKELANRRQQFCRMIEGENLNWHDIISGRV